MTIADSDILTLSASLTEAGLNGTSEDALVSGSCARECSRHSFTLEPAGGAE